MTTVYVLWHNGPDFEATGDTDQSKLLGVFSSEETARMWQEEASELPGFREAPDRFLVDTYELDARHWTTGFEAWNGPPPSGGAGPHKDL
jgi:hypothetical protein